MRNPLVFLTVGAIGLLLFLLSGSSEVFSTPGPPAFDVPTKPISELPIGLRQHNWSSPGSCGWASAVNALRMQARYDTANWIRNNRSGGTWPSRINGTLSSLKEQYAYTTDGDTRLLEWSLATRRGCAVNWYRGHVTNLIGRVDRNGKRYAVILDNNHPERYTYVEWNQFVREWKGIGGWAFAFVYVPPLPNLAI